MCHQRRFCWSPHTVEISVDRMDSGMPSVQPLASRHVWPSFIMSTKCTTPMTPAARKRPAEVNPVTSWNTTLLGKPRNPPDGGGGAWAPPVPLSAAASGSGTSELGAPAAIQERISAFSSGVSFAPFMGIVSSEIFT